MAKPIVMVVNDHVQAIAQDLGIDQDEARRFCSKVQGLCRLPPSFSAIARAVSELRGKNPTLRNVAELTCVLHGTGAGNVLTESEHEPEPEPEDPPVEEHVLPHASPILQAVHEPDSILTAAKPLVDAVARKVLDQLIPGTIEGKIIGFTGSGPYPRSELERLVIKLGGTPDQEGIEWDDVDWVVIGSKDFEKDYLRSSLASETLDYLTQEEFLGRVLIGLAYMPQKYLVPHRESHPGIRWIEAIQVDGDVDDPASDSVIPAPSINGIPPAHVPPVVTNGSPPKPSQPVPTVVPKPIVKPVPASPKPVAATPARTVTASPAATRDNGRPSSPPPPRPNLPAGWNTLREPPRSTGTRPLSGTTTWFDPFSMSSRERHPVQGTLDLRDESELAKMGYSVAKGVSLLSRRKALEAAVRKYGRKPVAKHLAWLIQFHRNTKTKRDAVECWKEDYEWIRSGRKNQM